MTREYDPNMKEISGFGGSYESGCRAMVLAGLEFLDYSHQGSDPKFVATVQEHLRRRK